VAVTGLPCARFVVGGGVTTPPPMLTCPVSGRSVEDAPTETVFTPGALVHTPFQYWKLRAQRDRHVLCLTRIERHALEPAQALRRLADPEPVEPEVVALDVLLRHRVLARSSPAF
jgi:hypothetical protein